jgi:hypothetical protein
VNERAERKKKQAEQGDGDEFIAELPVENKRVDAQQYGRKIPAVPHGIGILDRFPKAQGFCVDGEGIIID